jgi:hypothetical protein
VGRGLNRAGEGPLGAEPDVTETIEPRFA